MGYANTFNPQLQTNKPFSPNTVGNSLANPNKSLIPDCNVLSLAKDRIKSEWQTFLNNFGFTVYYKRTGYSFDNHDFLFGEDATSPFPETKIMKGFLEIVNNVHIFTNIGEENRKDILLTVSVDDYQKCWGLGTYPTAGDIFFIKNMACGDIEKQSEEVYKVTDKNLDEKDVDMLFGGYCWKINAIRFDYSYEPNAFVEMGNTQPNDDTFMGILTGGTSEPSPDEKEYSENIYEEANKTISEFTENSIYGNDV